MSTPQELAVRIDQLESREQIRELSSRYSHANDKQDPDLFMSIWHDDARWQPDPAGKWFVGLEAIRTRQQQNWESGGKVLHVTTNSLITVDGEAGRGVTDVLVLLADASDRWSRITATYSDEYARRGGRWGIVSRTTALHSWEPMA